MIWSDVCMSESPYGLGVLDCNEIGSHATQTVGLRHGMEVFLVEGDDGIKENCAHSDWR